jgi:pyruvate-formate lyase
MTDPLPLQREPADLQAAMGSNSVRGAVRPGMSTERTRRLKAALEAAQDELTSARAAIATRVMRERSDEPLVVRRALAFAAVLAEIPIAIHADELLVGGLADRRRGAVLFPETRTTGIMLHSRCRTFVKRNLAVVMPPLLRAVGVVAPSFRLKSRQIPLLLSVEFDDIETRAIQPFRVASAERDTLAREVLPHWRRRAAHRRYRTMLSPAQRHLQKEVAFTADNQFVGGVFLFNPGYEDAVRLGTDAVAERAEALGKAVAKGSPEADFYRAVAVAQRAVGVFAERYATLAENLAREAPTAARAAELRLVAATCRKVPRGGARTFREALQSFWLIYLAVIFDDGGMEVPFGRLDQLLWPYYKEDLAAQRIDAAAVLELFECFFVKASELTFVLENGANRIEDGNTGRLTLTLGGVDADGRDGTNELSHLLVQTAANARTLQPNVSVRLHEGAPADFVERALAVVVSGSNNLQLFNDAAIVRALVTAGFAQADANRYIITGCVQPAVADAYGSLCAAHVNGPRVLELFLARRRRQPESFALLLESLLAFLGEVLRETVGSLAHADRAHAELLPTPFLSGLMRGALERGRDVKSGGAYNNATGVNLVGLGTLASASS